MERKVPFVEDEYYHLYTRGVEKRIVFTKTEDYERFMLLLLLANQKQPVALRTLTRRYRGEPSADIFAGAASGEALTDILAYALMPNHIHIIAKERAEGGISRFMLKLMTAYSMYFNTRYERSGPLFTRPFRAKHLDTDDYLRSAIAYVHSNPLDLFEPVEKNGTADDALHFLTEYRYSSYVDHAPTARPESRIVAHGAREHIADALTYTDLSALRAQAAEYEFTPAILS